jgi:hypothetical protein
MADGRAPRSRGPARTHLEGVVLAIAFVPIATACSGSGGEALPSRTAAPSRTLSAGLEDRLAELAAPGSETTAAVTAQHLETAVVSVRGALDNESRSGPDAAAEAFGGVKQAARQLDQTLADVLPAPAPG